METLCCLQTRVPWDMLSPISPQIFPSPIPLCPQSVLPVAKAPHPRVLGWKQALSYFCDFRAEHMVVLTSSCSRHYH